MQKSQNWCSGILLFFVLVGLAVAEVPVCVRYIGAPTGDRSATDAVVSESLVKQGFAVSVCGRDERELEVWYYPYGAEVRGPVWFWAQVGESRGGVVLGSVLVRQEVSSAVVWEVGFAVRRGESRGELDKYRYVYSKHGVGLRGAAGSVAKWMKKRL